MDTTEHRYQEQLAKPPELLEDFELWLLHRAHRPEEFADAEQCAQAWALTRAYRLRTRNYG